MNLYFPVFAVLYFSFICLQSYALQSSKTFNSYAVQALCKHLSYSDLIHNAQRVSNLWNEASHYACNDRKGSMTLIIGPGTRQLLEEYRRGGLTVLPPARPQQGLRGSPLGPIVGPPANDLYLRNLPNEELLSKIKSKFPGVTQIDLMLTVPELLARNVQMQDRLRKLFGPAGFQVNLWVYYREEDGTVQARLFLDVLQFFRKLQNSQNLIRK